MKKYQKIVVNNNNLPKDQHRDFFKDVYAVVQKIPRGRVSTYGLIANFLGTGLSARMVGWAMNAAHSDSSIPAHRVVNRNGILTGKMHFETPSAMQERLEKEGVEVIKDVISNFRVIVWDPATELEI